VLVSWVVTDLVAGTDLKFSERGFYESKGLPGSLRTADDLTGLQLAEVEAHIAAVPFWTIADLPKLRLV
jgi:hypothetical protein